MWTQPTGGSRGGGGATGSKSDSCEPNHIFARKFLTLVPLPTPSGSLPIYRHSSCCYNTSRSLSSDCKNNAAVRVCNRLRTVDRFSSQTLRTVDRFSSQSRRTVDRFTSQTLRETVDRFSSQTLRTVDRFSSQALRTLDRFGSQTLRTVDRFSSQTLPTIRRGTVFCSLMKLDMTTSNMVLSSMSSLCTGAKGTMLTSISMTCRVFNSTTGYSCDADRILDARRICCP